MLGSRPGRRHAIGGCLAALAAPHVARAAARSVRFAHNNRDTSQFGLGAAAMAEAVAADPVIAGAIKIDIFGAGQLGDDMTMLNACKGGTIDGAFVGTSVTSNILPELGIINAPYLFADAARARAVLDDQVGADFMRASRDKGLPVLAFGENGVRHISSSVPVRTPADIRGLKIRVPQSEIMLKGFLAMGASAAPLPFNLVRGALASGEFQAQENAIGIIETAKLYEVQKYLCLTGHIYDAIAFIVSPDLLDDLTEPQRAALAAAARKGAAVSRQVSERSDREGLGRLLALGMTVISDVDVGAFRATCRPFLDGLAGTFGSDRVRDILNAGT